MVVGHSYKNKPGSHPPHSSIQIQDLSSTFHLYTVIHEHFSASCSTSKYVSSLDWFRNIFKNTLQYHLDLSNEQLSCAAHCRNFTSISLVMQTLTSSNILQSMSISALQSCKMYMLFYLENFVVYSTKCFFFYQHEPIKCFELGALAKDVVEYT